MTLNIISSIKKVYSNHHMFYTLFVGILIYLGFALLSQYHEPGTSWGWLGLLPTILVLIVAIVSKRAFESMIAGCVAGLVMIDPINLITPFADNMASIMGNDTIIWIILVCGLMGGLIQILEISGCLGGFTEFLKKIVKSRRQSLLSTVAVGIIIFIDDYLNCLAVSGSVKKLTDYYKVSREKLAYIVDSTAAPMCLIVPISTWAVYFSGLLEDNHASPSGEGMHLYLQAIPYMIYPWIALIIVILVAMGFIGDFGPMKKAEQRAKLGQPIPDEFRHNELAECNLARKNISYKMKLFNFSFPMLLLIFSTVYFDIDLLKGVIITSGVTIIIFWIQGLLTFEDQIEALFNGFKIMMYPIAVVMAGFFLKNVNDQLGMTQYVINSLMPFMTQQTFPAIIFTIMAIIVFGTGSSWGVFVISIPIVVPIAQHIDASMPLMVGALLSASGFGSHACFFSDSTLLASQGSGCTAIQHGFTQLPYAILGGIITIIIFLILGFIL